MELTEVVSLHVAIPVCGVVLCAVLVFVFGFKSPEQPPSFEFDEDSKKKRARKAKLQKSQTNGHAIPVSVVSEEQVVAKQQASPKSNLRASPPAKPLSPVRPTQGKLDSPKSDASKKPEQLKKMRKPVVKETVQSGPEEEDSEGWTTQISRKEKKLRHKKDDKVDSVNEEKITPITPEPVKEEVVVETEGDATPVQEQRNKKKNKKKQKELQQDVSKDDIKDTNQDLIEVDSGKKTPQVAKDVPIPDETGAAAAVATENFKKLPTDADTHLKKDTTEEEPTVKKTPKSKKKNKEKSSVLNLDLSADDDFVPPVISQKIEVIAEDVADTQQTKTAKSPKKKKKQKADNSPATEVKTASENSTLIEPTALPNISNLKLEEVSVENVSIDKPSEVVEKTVTESVPTVTATTEPSPDEKSSAQGATFDEMGDIWIEAKPKSKKKKARRDN